MVLSSVMAFALSFGFLETAKAAIHISINARNGCPVSLSMWLIPPSAPIRTSRLSLCTLLFDLYFRQHISAIKPLTAKTVQRPVTSTINQFGQDRGKLVACRYWLNYKSRCRFLILPIVCGWGSEPLSDESNNICAGFGKIIYIISGSETVRCTSNGFSV